MYIYKSQPLWGLKEAARKLAIEESHLSIFQPPSSPRLIKSSALQPLNENDGGWTERGQGGQGEKKVKTGRVEDGEKRREYEVESARETARSIECPVAKQCLLYVLLYPKKTTHNPNS